MKKYFLLAACLIFFGAAVYGYLQYVNVSNANSKISTSERQQQMIQLLGHAPRVAKNEPQGNTTYSGPYLSFSYPARALPYKAGLTQSAKNPSILEDTEFQIMDPEVFMTTQVVSSGSKTSLSEISGVALRTHDQDYTKQDITIDGENGIAFSKHDTEQERSAFFLVRGNEISLAVTGQDEDTVNSSYQAIISSLHFK